MDRLICSSLNTGLAVSSKRNGDRTGICPKRFRQRLEGEDIGIPVTWRSEPEYDGYTKGLYLFTALPGERFQASAEPPVIAVVVRAAESGFMLQRISGGAGERGRYT